MNNTNLRYERKFIIPSSYKSLIKHILYSDDLRFNKQYEQRIVNSIYLDKSDLQFFNENIDGLSNRKKYRIRWYGKLKKIKEPILEVKIKDNELGDKILYKLDHFNPKLTKDIMQQLLTSLSKSSISKYYLNEINFLKPTLLVSYKRNYYKSRIVNCRVTFDEDIKYYRLNPYSKVDLKSHKTNCSMIMEIKYPSNLQNAYIANLLNNIPLRLSKNSKYINGLIGFIGG